MHQPGSQDIITSLEISLEDAAYGCSPYIEINRREYCTDCLGAGVEKDNPSTACRTCFGLRQWENQRMIRIHIPAGVDTGSRLRIPGEGHSSLSGNRASSLYVSIMLKDHPLFLRKSDDLYCKLPVFASQAPSGFVAVIPTLEGKREIAIPADHISGKPIRLRGQGMPRLGLKMGRGDILVKVRLEFPSI